MRRESILNIYGEEGHRAKEIQGERDRNVVRFLITCVPVFIGCSNQLDNYVCKTEIIATPTYILTVAVIIVIFMVLLQRKLVVRPSPHVRIHL
jgi:hypothetical protein